MVEVLDPLLELALLSALAFRSLCLLSELLLHFVVHLLPLLHLSLRALELPRQLSNSLLPPAGDVFHPSLLIFFQRPDVALELLVPLLVRLALLSEDRSFVLQLLLAGLCLGELGLKHTLLVLQLLDKTLVRVQEALHVGVLVQLLLEVTAGLLVVPHQVLELALCLVQRLAQRPDVLLRGFEPHLEVPDLLFLP